MPQTESIAAVIVAAGRGERAGHSPQGPKQYRMIGGRPVLAWTLDLFLATTEIDRIVVVIHPDDHDLFASVRSCLDENGEIFVVDGAATRQGSVLRGLEALSDSGTTAVMIHDGVRPFVPASLIGVLADGLKSGRTALLPALPVTDTLKRTNHRGLVEETVPRAGLFGAQTPQCFAFGAILDAHRSAALDTGMEFTDDCSIAEWAGMSVAIVPGSPDNVKLTTARDLAMADEKLATRPVQVMPDIRTGNGYDVHALEAGDGVTLCGIFIPHDQALQGHSDADVALHALTDALLATCGAGDIGDHFPPTDPRWKDADSRIFLKQASDIVHGHGGTVMNADVTLICEAPRIGPHRQAMRENLADILGIELERCSVKATTNEKIGFVGRREGIAAIATATVAYRSDES